MGRADFSCRQLTAEDIPSCAQIVFEAFNLYGQETDTPQIPEVGIVADRLREYVSDTGIPGLLYGGFLGEEQIAFCLLRKLGIDEESWEISMLSVSPAQQGNGFGKHMVEAALEEILRFRGVLAVCAVTEGNEKALRLFASQGFESEASGVPVGGDMQIWMLRRDMRNQAAAELARKEILEDREKEKEELVGMKIRPEYLNSCESDPS